MEEKDVRQKIFRWFHKDLNSTPFTQTDANRCQYCGRLTKPPIGRPDMLIDPELVVEVKTLRADESSFPMDRITDKQRKWLDWWVDERSRLGFLGLGVIRPHGSRQYLDYLYIVPWKAWRRGESLIRPYQKSIPLEAGKGYKTELQEGKLDILHLFQHFQLERDNGKWQLPEKLQEVIVRE